MAYILQAVTEANIKEAIMVNILKIAILFLLLMGQSGFASAGIIFSDSFTGFTGINSPPTGWSQFNDAGLGVDGAQSTFWLASGNTTGSSPEGDVDYVRAFTSGLTGE